MNNETKDELRERIRDLEAELEKYKAIAALYRASLGDVKANTILEPLLRSRGATRRLPGNPPRDLSWLKPAQPRANA